MKLTSAEKNLMRKGRIKAIIKVVADQRYLIGFERKSKESRKAHRKILFPAPINLAALVKQDADLIQTHSIKAISSPREDLGQAVHGQQVAQG